MLLRVETDNKRGDVDNLLADTMHKDGSEFRWQLTSDNAPDVSLPDQDTGVVDGLRETALEDLRLETTLQEVLDLEGQHVIETHAALVEHTDADETADEGVTLEEALRVLVVELDVSSENHDAREGHCDAP